MKIYTQSKSWLAKFSVDLSRGIVAAIVATVLLTTGVLVSGLVVFSGSAPAQQPGHDGYSPPSSSSVVSAQDVATSIVGMSVSDSSASEPGAVVNSDYPSGIVTTDAAGDATVPVEITLYTPPANTPGVYSPYPNTEIGTFAGQVTMLADGSASFTFTSP